jgi:uncharacterized damage-inducible protein DinB
MTGELTNYQYRGARACVLLHEKHLRSCLAVWKQAKAAHVKLPETDDEDYQSLETLLRHILRAARGYMVWTCKQLNLPDPEIRPAPEIDVIEAEADHYLEHVLERWRLPLANVSQQVIDRSEFKSNWGVTYSIDGMLEHAVMHPIRHEFQLRELIEKQKIL